MTCCTALWRRTVTDEECEALLDVIAWDSCLYVMLPEFF